MLKIKRALWPDEIPVEVWNAWQKKEIVWITRLFNIILTTNRIT